MSTADLIDATPHRGIAFGHCVIIDRDEMVYAGPLESAPEPEGRLLLLHPDDFARLSGNVVAHGGMHS